MNKSESIHLYIILKKRGPVCQPSWVTGKGQNYIIIHCTFFETYAEKKEQICIIIGKKLIVAYFYYYLQ